MSKLRDNTEPLRLAPDRHSTGSRMDPALPLLPLPSAEVRSWFGEIDIYLFDQIIKGRFDRRRRVLDAGCGDGRNLIYLLRRGFTCFGIDQDPSAVEHVRRLAATLSPELPLQNFQVGDFEHLPWDDHSVDAVICSAALHFAVDEAHFGRMLQGMWRVLAPDGLFFARLASSIGLESRIQRVRGRVDLPDGSERFVVDEPMLLQWTERLGAQMLDPIKTTNVQHQRCMTTWCLLKPA
jgi:SAM-dependent methyltransferase